MRSGVVVEAEGPGGRAVGSRLRRLDAWAYRHPWQWGGALAAYGFAAALETGRGQPLPVRLAVGAGVAAGWCMVGVLRRRQGPSPSVLRRRAWTAAFAGLIALQALAGGLLRREPPPHATLVSLTVFAAVLLAAEAVHRALIWWRRRRRPVASAVAEEPPGGCPL